MQRYLVRRLVQAVISLLAMTIVVFALARISGNPIDAMLSDDATQESIDHFTKTWGLDKPLHIQYFTFLGNAFRGDFGDSLRWKRPALQLTMDRFPATMKLAGAAFLISLMIALPFGVAAAVKRDSWIDQFGKIIALIGQATPAFWLGIVLMWVFAVNLGWLPTHGMGGLDHYILPGLAMGWFVVAGILRLTRSAMLDVLDSEYIKMARIKGLAERQVIWKHALRNAAIPVMTFAGIIFAGFLRGFVVVEVVFAWPGLGRLAYQGVLARDFPIVQTVVLLMTVIFITVNLLVDIAYVYFDPRIRLGGRIGR